MVLFGFVEQLFFSMLFHQFKPISPCLKLEQNKWKIIPNEKKGGRVEESLPLMEIFGNELLHKSRRASRVAFC